MGNTIDMNEMEPVARPLLPIFFVLDTSGSMTGQPISMLNHAMEEVINIVGNFAASNSEALLKMVSSSLAQEQNGYSRKVSKNSETLYTILYLQVD